MAKLYFYKEYAGNVITTNKYWYGYGALERFVKASTSVTDDTSQFTLSGFVIEASFSTSGILAQTTSGYWVEGGATVGKNAAYNNGQNYINQIILNNKTIYENNLLCAAAAKYMTADDLQLLQDLQNRLLVRNQALEDNDLTNSRKVSFPKGYINLYNNLESLMNQKVGVVVSTTAMIVISAVVLTSIGLAAFFAYKAFAAESADDVKFSDELTAKLVAKLSAEDLEQLYYETEGIVTKARLKERFGTVAGIGSTLLWLVAGGAVVYWWKNRKTKKTK